MSVHLTWPQSASSECLHTTTQDRPPLGQRRSWMLKHKHFPLDNYVGAQLAAAANMQTKRKKSQELISGTEAPFISFSRIGICFSLLRSSTFPRATPSPPPPPPDSPPARTSNIDDDMGRVSSRFRGKGSDRIHPPHAHDEGRRRAGFGVTPRWCGAVDKSPHPARLHSATPRPSVGTPPGGEASRVYYVACAPSPPRRHPSRRRRTSRRDLRKGDNRVMHSSIPPPPPASNSKPECTAPSHRHVPPPLSSSPTRLLRPKIAQSR